MPSIIHYAIENSQLSLKGNWIRLLLKGKFSLKGIEGKRGALFSNYTLAKFIDEELKHDDTSLTKSSGRSIRTFSSGEQKKALLSYLINQQPDFLVLDNPFDCLDKASVVALHNQLEELAQSIPIIQLFKRKNDLLPFIDEVLVVEDEKLLNQLKLKEYLKRNSQKVRTFAHSLPPPAMSFTIDSKELVRFKDVSVAYEGKSVLQGINWTIEQGDFWQLVGRNGSGKTTLLTMITGDNPQGYGKDLYLFGRKKGSGESVWDIKKKVGYFTPAMTELFEATHNALEMITGGLVDSIGLYVKPAGRWTNLAKLWLSVLELEDLANKRFIDLTQLQQRLILIARAMIKHPPLLILDEPLDGLDDNGAALVVELINKIAAESSTTVIYVSHRTEPGISPGKVYELLPTANGSVGTAI